MSRPDSDADSDPDQAAELLVQRFPSVVFLKFAVIISRDRASLIEEVGRHGGTRTTQGEAERGPERTRHAGAPDTAAEDGAGLGSAGARGAALCDGAHQSAGGRGTRYHTPDGRQVADPLHRAAPGRLARRTAPWHPAALE